MRELQHIPAADIQQGNNPRRYFDEAEMAELVESVRESGILQPIILRRQDTGYQLVAGERRLRAFRSVNPDGGNVPAIILEEDDDADAVALIENTQRADMSPAEEAQASHALLKKYNGNRDEVCRIMGWNSSKLARRLALTLCSANVLDALAERRIFLGHAELLALVPKEKQDEVLQKVLAHDVSVSDLKTRLAAYCLDLSTAVFDKEQCRTCKHNSANQASLFAECVDSGQCGNPSCFEAKTQAHLDAILAEKQEVFPLVRIVGPGDDEFVPVDASHVGEEQYGQGCKACANFGCAIHSEPGLVGQVDESVCFDPVCNVQKKAAWTKAQQKALMPENAPVTDGSPSKPTRPTTSCSTGSCAPSKSSASQKLMDYRRKVYELGAVRSLKVGEAGAYKDIAALVTIGVRPDPQILSAGFEKAGYPKDRYPEARLYFDEQPNAYAVLLTAMVRGCSNQQLSAVWEHNHIHLEDFWKPDATFLDCLTKSQIEALLDEIGYAKLKEESALKKVLSGSKKDIVTKLLADPVFTEIRCAPSAMKLL